MSFVVLSLIYISRVYDFVSRKERFILEPYVLLNIDWLFLFFRSGLRIEW